jgi:hypothetical protein
MGATIARKVNLGDAMILVVAIAVSVAIAARPISSLGQLFSMIHPASHSDWLSWWHALARKQGPQFHLIQCYIEMLFCLMAPLTLALVVARLRQPRPSYRLLACQPGFVACAVLCLAAVIEVDLSFLQLATLPILVGIVLPDAAVFFSWLVLLATGRWQPEASWVDRTGRFAGVFWMAATCWLLWVAVS